MRHGLMVAVSLMLVGVPWVPTLAKDIDDVPPPGTVEVLATDAAGAPRVARVALDHALPEWADTRMELGGTWSYLIAEPDGVVVFDVGPRFPLAWSLVPFAAIKPVGDTLSGNRYILDAVQRTFPGKGISAITMSHWHADHTEDAPALQEASAALWGRTPTLHIHSRDRASRMRGLIPAGAESVFQAAGYKPGSWTWGEDLQDGAPVGRTGFRVLWLPGHTEGTIALISDELKMSLGRMPHRDKPRAAFWTEDLDAYPSTHLKFHHATYGFKHYSTHPGKELFEDWPEEPPEPLKKRPS